MADHSSRWFPDGKYSILPNAVVIGHRAAAAAATADERLLARDHRIA